MAPTLVDQLTRLRSSSGKLRGQLPTARPLLPLSLSLCCTPGPEPSPWTVLATVVSPVFAPFTAAQVHPRSSRQGREPVSLGPRSLTIGLGPPPLPFGREESPASGRAESPSASALGLFLSASALCLFPSDARSPQLQAKPIAQPSASSLRPRGVPSVVTDPGTEPDASSFVPVPLPSTRLGPPLSPFRPDLAPASGHPRPLCSQAPPSSRR